MDDLSPLEPALLQLVPPGSTWLLPVNTNDDRGVVCTLGGP